METSYNRLKRIQEEYPFLTFNNKGYQTLKGMYPKQWEKHSAILKEIHNILKFEIEDFVEFNNFKPRKGDTDTFDIRCQYKWNKSFTGVGYFNIELFKDNKKMNYKVTKEDLIGYIEGFPIEVVQKMLYYQVQQGNKENIEIFQKNNDWNWKKINGGFDWDKTDVRDTIEERKKFWISVIVHKNWGTFFNRFPKYPPKVDISNSIKAEEDIISGDKDIDIDFISGEPYLKTEKGVQIEMEEQHQENPFEEEVFIPEAGQTILVSDSEVFGTCERVFIANIPSLSSPVITVTKDSWEKMSRGNFKNIRIGAYKQCQDVNANKVVELTLEDISKGKGVGVPPHLIKIKLMSKI